MDEKKKSYYTVRIDAEKIDTIQTLKASFATKFLQDVVEKSLDLAKNVADVLPNRRFSDERIKYLIRSLQDDGLVWPKISDFDHLIYENPKNAVKVLKFMNLGMSKADAIEAVLEGHDLTPDQSQPSPPPGVGV